MVVYLILGVLILSLVGFVLGILLAIIAQIFKVKVDPRVDQIKDILPGINCGACGYPGCAGYADAILKDDAEINLCTPGASDVVEAIGTILGKKAEINLKMVAKVFCLGDDAIAKKDYIFDGEEECLTVHNYFQGEKSCKYSCVGKGNCIRVCPVDAIKRDDLNRIWIDSNLCVGCERCVSVCPTNVIKMVPADGGYFIACSSHYKGKVVKEICKKGCIGCNICKKMVGNEDRLIIDDFLAIVKYDSDDDLHPAALRCPSNVIVPITTQYSFMKENIKPKVKKTPVKKAVPKTVTDQTKTENQVKQEAVKEVVEKEVKKEKAGITKVESAAKKEEIKKEEKPQEKEKTAPKTVKKEVKKKSTVKTIGDPDIVLKKADGKKQTPKNSDETGLSDDKK